MAFAPSTETDSGKVSRPRHFRIAAPEPARAIGKLSLEGTSIRSIGQGREDLAAGTILGPTLATELAESGAGDQATMVGARLPANGGPLQPHPDGRHIPHEQYL